MKRLTTDDEVRAQMGSGSVFEDALAADLLTLSAELERVTEVLKRVKTEIGDGGPHTDYVTAATAQLVTAALARLAGQGGGAK